MPDLEEVSRRIEKLEKRRPARLPDFVQYLSPLLVVLIGAFFNHRIEQARRDFQSLELEVKRIQATQGFMEELFSGTPQRAFVAERLISKIVEKSLAEEITAIVRDYYAGKVEESVARNDTVEANKITEAAGAIKSRAGVELLQRLERPTYHIVVASESEKGNAILGARRLRDRGFRAEVLFTNADLYAVALGPYGLREAHVEKRRAVRAGAAPDDAYLMNQERVVETIEF